MGDDRVFVYEQDKPRLRGGDDVLDLIGEAGYRGATWVAVPVGRLPEDFFSLRTGVAGEIVQKFANYRLGLAVVGDVADRAAASESFAAWVREADRGRQVWFVADLDELRTRLGRDT
ncbi:DUF4180 domain-containing protein [Nonomuraea pusilla]|uniref:DUF4180 domain-containing protein n=1 Tax=Nonomuraea pusilla TaxID=46177 RepID=A0A1H7WY08_9ACTN|nr:DUF4180 domain-containing protein [Nonomuraea pusilla]SEM25749.1 protein of unknown function [Nonomuraea pusilla]